MWPTVRQSTVRPLLLLRLNLTDDERSPYSLLKKPTSGGCPLLEDTRPPGELKIYPEQCSPRTVEEAQQTVLLALDQSYRRSHRCSDSLYFPYVNLTLNRR